MVLTQKTNMGIQARITEKDTGIWTYTYDPVIGALTSVADPYGNTTTYEYNPQWQLYKVKDPRGNGIETVYTYDPNGNIATIQNPLDPLTTYVFNNINKITSITYPENSWISIAYDPDNSGSFTMTDPSGWNRYEFGPYCNLTKIIRFVELDQNNQPITHTTRLDYENDYLKTITDLATSAVTTFTYYPSGNLQTINDPLGHITTFTYNGLNKITRITDYLGQMTDFSYDLNGNLNSKIDGNRHETGYQSNYKGQVKRITDALGQVTQLFYGTGCSSCNSGVDKLTSVIDANGHTTSFEYDLAGRLKKETDPLGNIKTYVYGQVINPKTITMIDGKNNSFNFVFDALDRLKTIRYPDQTETNFDYDHRGNLTTASNPYIAYTFHYDARNRKDSQVTDMAGNIRSISYGFNGLNNRNQMTTPDNRLINYFYDLPSNSFRINTIQGDYTVSHDLAGRRNGLTFPNGVVTTYGYNEVNNLTNLLTQKLPATINSFVYVPDAVGNRQSMTNLSGLHTYQYDEINQLFQATRPSFPTENFFYDPVGNRIQSVVEDLDLLQVDTDYTYDYQNRLIRVQYAGMDAQYKYDPFGRRIEKNVNGQITRYVYDGDNILNEYDGAGNIKSKYVFNLAIDDPLSVEQAGNLYYYHKDGLGSVTELTNATGSVVRTYHYNSFGEIYAQSGNLVQPFNFTGREYDPESGLYYYRARYYDPAAGIFLGKDPIGFLGGDWNLFRYVRNNPVNEVDPLGLQNHWLRSLTPSFSFGSDQPIWRQIGDAQTPAIGGHVGGRIRTGGIFCTCSWERIGFERIYRDKCGNIIRREPVPSIFDPTNNFSITPGRSTQSGCFCTNPNGELQ